MLPIEKLEAYTVDRPDEVLVVQANVDGVADEIVVFRGYSSSTVRPTAADLNVPVLPEDGAIVSITRLKAPYNPQSPDVLEADIPWDEFAQRYFGG